jgi:uncharacterized protein (DUF362 family)
MVEFDEERRRLLRTLAGLPILGGLSSLAGSSWIAGPPPSASSAPARPVVARCQRDGLTDEEGNVRPGTLDEVLSSALTRAVGEDTPVEAMRRLFRPKDVVGIKLNSMAGPGLSPSPPLVTRLCDWLQEAGVPARGIVILDRSDRELEAAGFTVVRNGNGVRCMGIDGDHERKPRDWGPGSSRFARMLVEDLTALINVGVLKDHRRSGISVGLKNWYGVIDNPDQHHGEGCAPYIPYLASAPLIRKKLRLTVIDASHAQCHAGPRRNPLWVWRWNGVLASTDPVAVDAIAWRLIEARRKEVDLPPLADQDREPTWIADAAALGLGEADPEKITVMES